MGYLDGTTPTPSKTLEVEKDSKKQIIANPDYDSWIAKDQQVLGYLFNSVQKEVLAQVATQDTAAAAWSALKKGSMTLSAYFNKMKTLGDDLAAAGKVITDPEMVSFMLNGLDMDYNPVVSSIMGSIDPINQSDLYAQLLAYES